MDELKLVRAATDHAYKVDSVVHAWRIAEMANNPEEVMEIMSGVLNDLEAAWPRL